MRYQALQACLFLSVFLLFSSQVHAESGNYSAYVDLEVMKAFENQTHLEVFVRYIGDMVVTEENEQEMVIYYQNISIPQNTFSYISETELNITSARLSAFKPAFIAIATKQGVDQLANDSHVISVGMIREISELDNQTNYSAYVDPEVLKAFENQTWVSIIVRLVDTSNITVNPLEPLEERINDSKAQKAYFSNISDAIVANISEDYMEAHGNLVTGFGAKVTREGLLMLANDSRISKIIYSSLVYANDNQSNQSTRLPLISSTVLKEINESEWIKIGVFVETDEAMQLILTELNETGELRIGRVSHVIRPAFEGNISRSGFEKLRNNPNVTRIISNNLTASGASQTNESNKSISPQEEFPTQTSPEENSNISSILMWIVGFLAFAVIIVFSLKKFKIKN